VNSATFDSSGKILAAADGTSGMVTLWSLSIPAHPKKLGDLRTGERGDWTVAGFSPDGRILAVAADKAVRLWNVANPARPRAVGTPLMGPSERVTSLAFGHRGGIFAVGSADDNVYLWDVTESGHATPAGPPLAGHTDTVNSVAFSPDDRDRPDLRHHARDPHPRRVASLSAGRTLQPALPWP